MSELVDARGLLCPIPVIRLALAAVDAAPGTVITVWATDSAARLDVPAWARMRGHVVVSVKELTGGAVAMNIRIAPSPTAAT
ncbi:MAG: sulfurtransferase TusA family protein [Cellulomonas sp.]